MADDTFKRIASLVGTAANGAYIMLLFISVRQLWGTETLGNFAWSFQLQQILTFAACFGLPGLVLAEQSCGEISPNLLWNWGHRKLLTRLGTVSIGYFILIALLFCFDPDSVIRSQIMVYLFPHMILIGLTRFHLAIMSGKGEIISFSLLTTLRLILAIGGMLFGYLLGFGLTTSVLIGLSGGELIVLFFTYRLARPADHHLYLLSRSVEQHLIADLKKIKLREKSIGLSSILSEASSRLDILITGLILNTSEAGLFAFLSQFARTPFLIAQSQLRLLVPALSRLRNNSDFTRANNVIKDNLYSSYGLVFLLVLTLSGIHKLLPQVDSGYEVILFWGLFFGFSLQAIPGIYGSLFIAFGRPDVQIKRLFLLLISVVISITIFTYLIGIGGAAIAIIFSYLLHFILIKRFFSRSFPEYHLHMPVIRYTVMTLLICLPGLVICLI